MSAATDGELTTIEGRPALRFERRLDYPIERVWRAISEPEELRHWFPGAPEWELELGATFEAEGETGTATEVDPPRVLAHEWGGQRIRFELTPDGEGCILRFSHIFDERPEAAHTAAGWVACFDRLEGLLAGEPVGEKESLEGWREVHEGYAERWGIDPEVGRRVFAEHHTQG